MKIYTNINKFFKNTVAILFMILINYSICDCCEEDKENLKIMKTFNSSDGLYERAKIFGSYLNSTQQNSILLTCLYNDLRLFEDNPEKRHLIIKEFLSPNFKNKFIKMRLNVSIDKENWLEQIVTAHRKLADIPGTKPLDRSFVLNIWLYHSGLCPLLHFAFDQWYDLNMSSKVESKNMLANLVDLSTTYLYRLIPVNEIIIKESEKIGSGAYSNVYKSFTGNWIYKVPKNLASFHFESYREYIASLYASDTALSSYLPDLLDYNKETGIIKREFIKGITGCKLLMDSSFLATPFALDQIETIYNQACSIYEKDELNFDIHPGNFMWCEDQQRWFLVDIGPMPKIVSDYFPRKSFKKYFKKIWLDRHKLMISVPIRSLDIDQNLGNFFSLEQLSSLIELNNQ